MSYPREFTSHWWLRPGIAADSRILVWHVLLDDQPHVQQLSARYQAHLGELAELDLIPTQWLHMTMLIVGDAKHAPASSIEMMMGEVRDRLGSLKPIETMLSKPLLHDEGVVLVAQPEAAFDDLYAALTDAVQLAFGASHPGNVERFVPHISLAYANTTAPTAPTLEALRNTAQDCPLTVSSVCLVLQERAGHLYRWEPVNAVLFGQ